MVRFRTGVDLYSADELEASGRSVWTDHDVVVFSGERRRDLGQLLGSIEMPHSVVSVTLDEMSSEPSIVERIAQRTPRPVVAVLAVPESDWQKSLMVRLVRQVRNAGALLLLAVPPAMALRMIGRRARVAVVYEPPRDLELATATAGEPAKLRGFRVAGVIHRAESMSVDLTAAPTRTLGATSSYPQPTGKERSVNTIIAQPGTSDPVTHDRPLEISSSYDLLVNIGRRAEGTLLSQGEAVWPDELLPKGIWLRAVLTLDGESEAAVRTFYLPPDGESFSCQCPFGGEHGPGCEPDPWTRFPIHTPDRPELLSAALVIYYEVAAIHAQSISLPVGGQGQHGPSAKLLGRLSTTLNDLGRLAGRTASVVVSPSRVVVNGVSFADNPFAISAQASDTAALDTRQVLYTSHFSVDATGELRSRYDSAYAKPARDFEHDLANLARIGAQLYTRLFTPPGADTGVAASLPDLIRQEAHIRQRPPTLQIMDPSYEEDALLWAVVYDLPVGGDPDRYEICPAVSEFGPLSAALRSHVPACCPHAMEHRGRGNVLCPFGFWGLSCILEQPPDVGRDLENVVAAAPERLTVLMASDSNLDRPLTQTHVAQLKAQLPEDALAPAPVETEEALAEALGPESMDVVYFYCHSGYQRQGKGAVSHYLNFGSYYIEPIDVSMWARVHWPNPHWPQRHPLVVLNGCHTTETTSGTVNSFVPAFTQWAAASGVLGTEVTMEQGLAGWVTEQIIAALVTGSSVGEAVRATRWKLFGLGNVMGLAYTPYCLANLRLRPAV